jgi:hypothetical protein
VVTSICEEVGERDKAEMGGGGYEGGEGRRR